jgi:hypothetical protein
MSPPKRSVRFSERQAEGRSDPALFVLPVAACVSSGFRAARLRENRERSQGLNSTGRDGGTRMYPHRLPTLHSLY